MDKLDWRFDKEYIIVNVTVYVALAAVLTIVVGYLLHFGWGLYDG